MLDYQSMAQDVYENWEASYKNIGKLNSANTKLIAARATVAAGKVALLAVAVTHLQFLQVQWF